MAGLNDTQELTAPPDVAFPVRVCSVSEKGSREQNEDNMVRFNSPYGHVVIVADGMGGHGHGDLASALVVNGFQEALTKQDSADISIPEAIKAACSEVNASILQMAADLTHSVMGSTVVMVVLHHGEFYIAHVGDSRAYLMRDGVLTRLTKDHSLVQREVDEGLLTEEQAKQDSRSSTLTRALGTANGENIEVRGPEPLHDGDGILLCTDGLHGFAFDRQIEDAILFNQMDPQKVTTGLVNLAIGTYFSNDNVTVQYVQIGKPKPAASVRPVFGRSKAGAEVPPPHSHSPADRGEHSRKRSLITRILLWLMILLFLAVAFQQIRKRVRPGKPPTAASKGQERSSNASPAPLPAAPAKPPKNSFRVGVVISDPAKRSLKDLVDTVEKCWAVESKNLDKDILLLPEDTKPGEKVSPNEPDCEVAFRPSEQDRNHYNVDALIIYEMHKPSRGDIGMSESASK